MSACWRFRVTGRVQGVFYRASAHEQARQLGLTGWVQNVSDGSVELLACGADAAVDSLEKWLHSGPPAARVLEVTRTASADAAPARFTIRY